MDVGILNRAHSDVANKVNSMRDEPIGADGTGEGRGESDYRKSAKAA